MSDVSNNAESEFSSNDEVQELVDAISGATWETRNKIMRERFADRLKKDEGHLPQYRPPGQKT